MRILMYRWKAYNQFDIIRNLAIRGHIVDEIKGDLCSFEEDPAFENRLNGMLDANKYDLMFTVNYFPLISDICEKRKLRYVSWCCDSPLATMYNKSIYNSVNTVFTFDKLNQMTFEDLKAPVYYLPLCAAADRTDEQIKKMKDITKYDADISFVGSMYNKNSYDEVYDHLPEYLRGYFDAALKMQMNIYGDYMLDDILDARTVYELNRHFVLAKTDRSFSDLSLIFSTTVLGFKIAQMERKTVLADLSKKFNVNIYTDDNTVNFIKAKNCGTVDYWSEAPLVFNRSKININLTLRSIRTGIPLRVWDILGCGGFCITNYQAELPLYFTNKQDIVYFEDRKDLVEKTDYYLKHEDERKEIAFNGYKKVKELHTYQRRLDEMAKLVKDL